jgi:hypothetical protein
MASENLSTPSKIYLQLPASHRTIRSSKYDRPLHYHAKFQRILLDNLFLPGHQLRHIPARRHKPSSKPISLLTSQECKGITDHGWPIIEEICVIRTQFFYRWRSLSSTYDANLKVCPSQYRCASKPDALSMPVSPTF